VKRRTRTRLFAGLLVLAALAAGGGVALRRALFSRPFAAFTAPLIVEIPPGTPTLRIGAALQSAGVLRASWHLLALRLFRPTAVLQAGDYRFSQPATAAQVFDRLARGDIHLLELRIPEGANIFDIARLVEQAGFASAAEFLRVARSPDLVRDIAPQAASLEGFLFPSTYRFRRRTSAVEIAQTLVRQFRRSWEALGVDTPVLAAVTLASLVEKETALASERPRVASVYASRLRLRMKLECDPTVIYAALLENRWRGVIRRSDLERNHPYNTYRRAGPPPGPIANPGLESLRAALAPQPTGELYFVARPDGSGGHVFSSKYAAHLKAVAAYRRGQQASRRAPAPPRTPAKYRRG
jgi:UPF0755 protein